jgi:hypothetical protein
MIPPILGVVILFAVLFTVVTALLIGDESDNDFVRVAGYLPLLGVIAVVVISNDPVVQYVLVGVIVVALLIKSSDSISTGSGMDPDEYQENQEEINRILSQTNSQVSERGGGHDTRGAYYVCEHCGTKLRDTDFGVYEVEDVVVFCPECDRELQYPLPFV